MFMSDWEFDGEAKSFFIQYEIKLLLFKSNA